MKKTNRMEGAYGMLMYATKVLVSALLIVLVSEISKKNTLLGSAVISIPWMSVIVMCWMFLETNDAAKVAAFSSGVLWLTIPSLLLFFILPLLISKNVNFYVSLLVSAGVTALFYTGALALISRTGIKL